MVRTRREFPAVREVQILRDQRAPLSLRGAPKIRIGAAQELLSLHGVNVVPDVIQTGCNLQRQVLVQLCFHRMSGAAGTGRFLFSRRRRECNHGAQVIRLQGREVRQDILYGISRG